MKILYLHGWNSGVGGVKPTYLKSHGHDVHEPALDHEDFQAALDTAQAAFDQHQPDVVVGSSRGGTQIIHSRADDVVPFADSVALISKSGLPEGALIEAGHDHRLADPEPLEALLRAVEGRD